MAINAPVRARIINATEVEDLVVNQNHHWVWGERTHAHNPAHAEIWHKAATTFGVNPQTVIFMVAVENGSQKFIDLIEGTISGVRYESGAEGMLNIELRSADPRWTKIHGFYDCRHGVYATCGWLSLTPRR